MLRTLFRIAFTTVAVVGIVLTLGSLLLPSGFEVTRSTVVQAGPERLWPLLAEPRRWPEWSAWNRRDPAMALSFEGPASGAGAAWSWRSESQGNGRMRLTAAEPGRRVDYELRFEGFDAPSTGSIVLEPVPGGTRVTWAMQGDMGANPFVRWMALLMDRRVGPDFDEGLANLKALAEQG